MLREVEEGYAEVNWCDKICRNLSLCNSKNFVAT